MGLLIGFQELYDFIVGLSGKRKKLSLRYHDMRPPEMFPLPLI